MDKQTGFMLIDKPLGITSYGVIAKLRKLTNIKKIGHAGTLDPLASGLLIVAIGREATREISNIVKMSKEYISVFELGKETDTYDAEGKIVKEYQDKPMTGGEVDKAISYFTGKQEQVPPMFSAKKIGGKKLYELAREGKEIERPACSVVIHELELLEYEWPELRLRINCSSGTYIRSLAFDMGRSLGCGAYVKELRRTKINEYEVSKAVKLASLTTENWTHYLFQLKSDKK